MRTTLLAIILFFALGFQLIPTLNLTAQATQDFFEEEEYEDFPIVLRVENLGNYNLEAIYYRDELYLPVISLFQKLKIYITHSPTLDTISGYVESEENSFFLDTKNGHLEFRDKIIRVDPDEWIHSSGDLFLSTALYESLFRFDIRFDFRSLTAHFRSDDFELPVIKLLRLERMRQNIGAIRGEIIVDTIYNRDYSIVNGLVFDWNLHLQQGSDRSPNYLIRNALGGELFGGEVNLQTVLGNRFETHWQNQYANWRYVNNDLSVVRQISAGNIYAPLFSRTNSRLFGVSLTNTPSTFRQSFGTYTIQKQTRPGWEIELYVNNVLVGFTTADASGEFSFEVPLVYGSSNITLRYYGPYGEEEIEEEFINIPFEFVPQNELEYQLHSGVSFDTLGYKFVHGRVSYGLNKRSTITVGYESYEENIQSRHMPFIGASMLFFDNTMVNFNWVANTLYEANIMHRTNFGFTLEGQFLKYQTDQDAKLTPNNTETTLRVLYPFSLFKRRGMLRASYRRNSTSFRDFQFFESNLSFNLGRLNLGLLTNFYHTSQKNVFAGINSSLHLPNQWTVYAYSLADVKNRQMNTVRLQVQKRFGHQFIGSFNFNHSFRENRPSFSLTAFIDLNKARASASFSTDGNNWNSSQSFFGSHLISNTAVPFSSFSRTNLGRGVLDVMFFLDINHNGIRDEGEPLIPNVSVNLNRGQQVLVENDTINRFISLEPYTQHILKIDPNSLESIYWQLDHTTLGVYPDPNQVKKLVIPVKPMAEIEGRILLDTGGDPLFPLNNVAVNIVDETGRVIHRTNSDPGGYFSYLGLAPGKYSLTLDESQLKSMNYTPVHRELEFTIQPTAEGEFLSGLDLVLLPSE